MLLSTKIFLAKVTSKVCQKKLFEQKYLNYYVLDTNQWTYEIKDLNKEKILESFSEKQLLLSKFHKCVPYPEIDSHIKDNVRVVQDLSNFATKKELNHATDVDIFNLPAKRDLLL